MQKAADLAPESDLALRWDIADLSERIHDTLGERPQQAADLEVMDAIAESLGTLATGRILAPEGPSLRAARGNTRKDSPPASRRGTSPLADDTERRVPALRNEGGVKWRQGDLAGSQESARPRDRIGLGRRIDRLARRLPATGMVKEHLGDYPGAEAAYRTALDGARQRGDRREIALGLNDIGIASYYQSELERARRFEEEALRIRVEMGDRPGEALVLNNLALTTAALGDAAAARHVQAHRPNLRGHGRSRRRRRHRPGNGRDGVPSRGSR